MRVLVLNPPFLPLYSRESRSPAVTKSGTLYYPMWLAHAVGYIEKHGHQVLFLDAPASGLTKEGVLAKAAAFRPQLTVLNTSTPSIYSDVDAACDIKRRVPETFTILVGTHVSALPEETLSEAPVELDAVAVSEYDATLVELAARLAESPRNDDLLAGIRGIAFRKADGGVALNERRPFIDDLDDIPPVTSVYRKHLDITPYFYSHSRHPLVVIVTGRGCPFHCTFCVYPQTLLGHRYRKRSIENIVAEFLYVRENFPGVREIMIEDDTFTADRRRCRELSRALIEAGATRIPWSANSRADVDLETMRLMKRAGCRLLCVGFESGDQKILDNIGKSIKISQIRRFMKDAGKAGILVHGCFMVGNAGETAAETEGTLRQTLDFAKELNPDTAQFYPIMVYPGTKAYDLFKAKGWITTGNYREWLDKEGLHSSVVSNPELTYEQLVDFCDRARREFYLRPRYILSKVLQIVLSPGEARRIFKAFGTFHRHLFRLGRNSRSVSPDMTHTS